MLTQAADNHEMGGWLWKVVVIPAAVHYTHKVHPTFGSLAIPDYVSIIKYIRGNDHNLTIMLLPSTMFLCPGDS